MTDKITLTNLVNLTNQTTAVNAINSNSEIITLAMDNTLSRDGTQPNTMGAALDMNNNHILNLPSPSSPNEPARLADLSAAMGGPITFNSLPTGGTAGQFLTKNSSTNFDAGWTTDAASLPVGGTTGQILFKNSNSNYDASWNTLSQGALALYFPPQGRLTLASGVPVMKASQTASNIVYYTPYAGNMVPIYNGSVLIPTQVPEVFQLTSDTTKSPAAVAINSVYDIFVWNDSGTLRATRGPAWTNDTTRGYTLTMINGINLNTSAITNGPGPLLGTWVGTIRSNSSATVDYTFGAAGPGGVAAFFGVWNAYNRVLASGITTDTSIYTYTSTTTRAANNSAGNRFTWISGSAEDSEVATYGARTTVLNVANAFTNIGIGLDSTSTYLPGAQSINFNPSVTLSASVATVVPPQFGVHFISALEKSDGANANGFNGNNDATLCVMVRN